MPTSTPKVKEFKFGLGADPEFNLEINNNKLHAQNAIQAILEKSKTFKPRGSSGYELTPYGTIGWDGHSATGEIRPNASPKPSGIVENLGKMFEEFHKAAPLFEISTLSRTGVIGGHIHLELPKVRPGEAKMKAIHKRMISLYLPIIMGECKVNLNIRIKGNYGHLCTNSAYRVESKFTHPDGSSGYTYELRCPSAEWMTTPKIAGSTLAYLGVVFNEIMNHPKHFEKICKDIIIRTDAQGSALQTLALCEYKALTENLFKQIKKCVKTFELYDLFKEECDYILNPEKVLADKQAANYDVRLGWGLKIEKKEPSKRTIVSEKATKKIAKEQDLDTLSKFVKIGYNEDMNVDTFAQTISQRSAAHNWKLNNNYFLFGVRKGIKGYIVADGKGQLIVGKEMIKTSSDADALDALMIKMRSKARNTLANYDSPINKLNFKTGKVEKIKNETYIIGIPYDDRVDNNTKKFIEMIYDLDKNKLKKINNKEEPLINDYEKPEEERGEFYKTLNNVIDETKEIASVSTIRSENDGHTDTVIREIYDEEREIEIITENDHSEDETTEQTQTTLNNTDTIPEWSRDIHDHTDGSCHCGQLTCEFCNDEFGDQGLINVFQREYVNRIATEGQNPGMATFYAADVGIDHSVDINNNEPSF